MIFTGFSRASGCGTNINLENFLRDFKIYAPLIIKRSWKRRLCCFWTL